MAPNTKAISLRSAKNKTGAAPKKLNERRLFSDPAGNESLAVVEYHKTETVSLRINGSDITTRGRTHQSYDLLWKVPGFGVQSEVDETGTLVHLGHSEYQIENLTDFILYVRVQRPMGYRAAPASLAAWEPITQQKNQDLIVTVDPRQIRKFTISNASTEYTMPRHVNRAGTVYVHLLSWSIFRDVANVHGNQIDPPGVGFVLQATTHFRVSDGTVGAAKGYIVDTLPTAEHLDFTDRGPAVPVTAADLLVVKSSNDGKDRVYRPRYLVAKNKVQGYVQLGAIIDTIPLPQMIRGLDPTTLWQIPAVPVLIGGQKHMSYHVKGYAEGADVMWKLMVLDASVEKDDFVATWRTADKLDIEDMLVFPPGTILTPVPEQPVKMLVNSKRRAPSRNLIVRVSLPDQHSLMEGYAGLNEILDSVIMIVDVVRKVATFAAAVGFLEERGNVLGRVDERS